MRITTSLTLSVVVMAALAGTVIATAIALLWNDEFDTRRGWPTYYAGISGLVRAAPLVGTTAAPQYTGSVGARGRAPWSELSVPTAGAQAETIWRVTQGYLRQQGFIEMPVAEPANPGTGTRAATYLAPRGGGIVRIRLGPGEGMSASPQLQMLHIR